MVVTPHRPPHPGIPPTALSRHWTHPPQSLCSNDNVSRPPGRKPRSPSAHFPFPFLTILKTPSETICMREHWILCGKHDIPSQKGKFLLVQQGSLITPQGRPGCEVSPATRPGHARSVLASWVWGKGRESCSPRQVRNSCVGSGELTHTHSYPRIRVWQVTSW